MPAIHFATLLLSLAANPDTVMLDFRADWCGPCRAMEPVVRQMVAEGYPIQQVNIDQDRALAARFHVQSIPCFVMLVGGREVGRVVGMNDASTIASLFRQAGYNPAAQIASGPPRSNAVTLAAEPTAAQLGTPAEGAAVAATFTAKDSGGTPWGGAQLAPTNGIAAESPAAGHASPLSACVRIKVADSAGNSYGSGTIVDARGGEALVLTCAHVFRDSDGKGEITVDLFCSGGVRHVPGHLVGCNLERDVGLVGISTDQPLTAARVAPPGTTPKQGDRVTTVGCSNGADPTVQESHIDSLGRFRGPPNLQVAGQPVSGRSGGGLFNVEGQVIGVCNAADPEDNEGLYAALESIYRELDRAGLSFVYRGVSPGDSCNIADHTNPPPMPLQMPLTAADASLPASTAKPPATADANAAKLTPDEIATLAELREKAQGAEVICIVRPLDPKAKSEIIVLDRASPAFLEKLGVAPPDDPSRRLTSLAVPESQAPAANR